MWEWKGERGEGGAGKSKKFYGHIRKLLAHHKMSLVLEQRRIRGEEESERVCYRAYTS